MSVTSAATPGSAGSSGSSTPTLSTSSTGPRTTASTTGRTKRCCAAPPTLRTPGRRSLCSGPASRGRYALSERRPRAAGACARLPPAGSGPPACRFPEPPASPRLSDSWMPPGIWDGGGGAGAAGLNRHTIDDRRESGPMTARRTENVHAPILDGELRFDDATRNARADDFGHIVHKTAGRASCSRGPPTTWRRRSGGPVSGAARSPPQGQRHSTFGRAQVEDGIVADMSMLHTIGAVEDDRVVVEAGAKWSDVLARRCRRARRPPCSPTTSSSRSAARSSSAVSAGQPRRSACRATT